MIASGSPIFSPTKTKLCAELNSGSSFGSARIRRPFTFRSRPALFQKQDIRNWFPMTWQSVLSALPVRLDRASGRIRCSKFLFPNTGNTITGPANFSGTRSSSSERKESGRRTNWPRRSDPCPAPRSTSTSSTHCCTANS